MSLAAPLRLSLQAPRRVPAGGLGVRGLWRDREAVRIRLQDGEGGWGLGEALPLPGYSRDDAAAAERVLGELRPHSRREAFGCRPGQRVPP